MSDDRTKELQVQVVTLEKKEKKRGRGRPPKIPIKPTTPEVAQLMKNKQKHRESDPLIQQITQDADSLDVLDVAMLELAKEASSLDFERGEAERKGNDTTGISSKKINATKAIIDTYLRKRDSVVKDTFDFKSKKFQKLFEFWAMKFRRCCEGAGMSEEQIQRLFQVAGEEFEDWEDEALRYIKSEV